MQTFSVRSLLLLLVLGLALPLGSLLVYFTSIRIDSRTGFAYELARGGCEHAA